MDKRDLQKLYDDFRNHLQNMTDEEWKQSIAEAEAACANADTLDDFLVFTDSQGTCHKVTNAELYCVDKETGEVRFHFPLNTGVLPRE